MTIQKIEKDPNPEIVIFLEGLLIRARRGELLSIAVGYIDDSKNSGKCNHRFRPSDLLTLIGVVDVLKSQLKASVVTTQQE